MPEFIQPIHTNSQVETGSVTADYAPVFPHIAPDGMLDAALLALLTPSLIALLSRIKGFGKYQFGDISSGDDIHTVTHGLGIAGDYIVICSLFGGTAASAYNNNDSRAVVAYHSDTNKANEFKFTIQEDGGGTVQNLAVVWMIISM